MPRQVKRIIVEGVDGSGKTTLIGYLRDQFHNLELIRNDLGPKQDFIVWWPEQLEREKSAVVPIHDRFFYSELVYGPVLRGKLAVPWEMVTNISWFLRASAFLIYARPPIDSIRKASKVNEQMEGVHDNLLKLLELYDQLMLAEMAWYQSRFICWDWTKGNPKEVEAAVERYLEEPD